MVFESRQGREGNEGMVWVVEMMRVMVGDDGGSFSTVSRWRCTGKMAIVLAESGCAMVEIRGPQWHYLSAA